MPQLISVKFAQEEMPAPYDPNGVAEVAIQEFVVAERDGDQDVGFVAAIEWVSSEQLKRRLTPHKKLVRRATPEEKELYFQRRALERKAMGLCKEKARELNLPMKISCARISPRDERIVFHFTSDQRVDFRQLVRELSIMLRSRIELWQIGVRDEAKQVDGFGVCGLRTCCSSWLPEFRPINIRMAKEQDIHLPPAKLSGLCGRLLCCLSYEVDQYREMGRALMPKGATIRVGEREGVIIDRNIITQSYSVQFQEGAITLIKASEISDVRVPEQMKQMARAFEETEQEERPREIRRSPAAPPVKRTVLPAQEISSEESSTAETPEAEEKSERGGRRKKRRRRRSGGGSEENRDRGKAEIAAAPADEAGFDAGASEGEENVASDGQTKSPGRRRRRRRGGRKKSEGAGD